MDDAFTLRGEAARSPLVVDSPHSWRDWPVDGPPIIASPEALMTSWDAWVDQIWAEAAEGLAPVLSARFHRAYIDANRARDDIDHELLAAPWPGPVNASDKTRRGFGLLRRFVLPGVPLYGQPLAVQEVQQRLVECYDPYHAELARLIDAAHSRHGHVLHIDGHSMKSVGNAMNEDDGAARPDFVISDLDGACADARLIGRMVELLCGLGYSVTVNHPYRGGELIRRHADPARCRLSVQIEINRRLYMNEASFERSSGYARLVADLRRFVRHLL